MQKITKPLRVMTRGVNGEYILVDAHTGGPEEWFDFDELHPTMQLYFRTRDYTELMNRMSQVKDAAGLRENQELTGDILADMSTRYTKETYRDNMTDFFNHIIDWDAAAKWGLRVAPVTLTAGFTLPNLLKLNNAKSIK